MELFRYIITRDILPVHLLIKPSHKIFSFSEIDNILAKNGITIVSTPHLQHPEFFKIKNKKIVSYKLGQETRTLDAKMDNWPIIVARNEKLVLPKATL